MIERVPLTKGSGAVLGIARWGNERSGTPDDPFTLSLESKDGGDGLAEDQCVDLVDLLVGVVQNAILEREFTDEPPVGTPRLVATGVSLAREETPLALIEGERGVNGPREPASDRRDEGLAGDA